MAALDKTRTEDSEEFGQPALDESAGRQGLVLSLANRITDLADSDEDVEIANPELGHRLALSVKPYVDRLISLRHLLNPVGRIIEKREKMEDLRGESPMTSPASKMQARILAKSSMSR